MTDANASAKVQGVFVGVLGECLLAALDSGASNRDPSLGTAKI